MTPEDYRAARAGELRSLARILERGVGVNAGMVRRAANMCAEEMPEGERSWGYDVDPIVFRRYQGSKRVRPKDAKDVELSVDVSLTGRCIRDKEDPFLSLEMNLVINGKLNVDSDGDKSLKAAWHLDKHQYEEGDSMYEAHPAYHFQFGGRKIWGLKDYGHVIIPEPPRIAHPPLDGILAVDFVLSNYLGDVWLLLKEESPEYVRLVRDAQERCWQPYAEAIASAWEPGPIESKDWPGNLLWPQLMPNYSGV